MNAERTEIHCPRCDYRPHHEDRWVCTPSCGTQWHTFWTRGVCPGCGIKWPTTQCPACQAVSPHEAWYRNPTESSEKNRTEHAQPEFAGSSAHHADVRDLAESDSGQCHLDLASIRP